MPLSDLMAGIPIRPPTLPPSLPNNAGFKDSVEAAKSEPINPPLPPDAPVNDGKQIAGASTYPNAAHYLRIIEEYRRSAETDRQPYRSLWDTCWDLFNNVYDFSTKADWQSKNWIPKISTLVRYTTAVIKEALISQDEFAVTDGYGDLSKAKSQMMNKLKMFAAKKAGFIDKLVEAIMGGLITPGVNLKIYPKSERIDTSRGREGGPANFNKMTYKNMISVEAIPEYSLLRDPTGANKFKIHIFEMDLADLKEIAEDPANGYDKDMVAQIQSTYNDSEKDYEKTVQSGGNTTTVTHPTFRKRIVMEEFWGDIPDENGKVIHKFGTMSRCNGKFLVRPPMANPFRHQKDPFICGFPSKVPFSTWHEAYVYCVTGIAKMITESMNLSLDAAYFDSVRSFEVDVDRLVDPQEIASGVWPGKAFKVDKQTNQSPVISPLQMGGVSSTQEVVYQTLTREFNNGASTSEFSAPQLGGGKKGKATATEVREASGGVQIASNDLARTLEREVIEPAWDMIGELIIQYFDDFQNPEVMDILGNDALVLQAVQNDEERVFLLGGNYCSKSRAISGIIQKHHKIQQYSELTEILKAFPQALAMINIPVLFKDYVEVIGFDGERVLLPPPPPPGTPPGQPPLSPLAQELGKYRAQHGTINPLNQMQMNPFMPTPQGPPSAMPAEPPSSPVDQGMASPLEALR